MCCIYNATPLPIHTHPLSLPTAKMLGNLTYIMQSVVPKHITFPFNSLHTLHPCHTACSYSQIPHKAYNHLVFLLT